MDEELKNFIKLWTSATACLIYCYYISSKLSKGILRFLSILPIMYLFTTLPFQLTTMSLGILPLFFLGWLANFKLLLFSFDKGLLSPPPPNILLFISIASLPIIPKKYDINQLKNSQNQRRKPRFLALKSLTLVLLIYSYKHKYLMTPYVVLTMCCVHMYIALEFMLAISAIPVQFFGFEIEPQFNDPHLSTSIQNFWGRRWNLMVTNILRSTIYLPMRHISSYFVGRNFVSAPAIVATFVVSGLMHEVIYFYMTRVSPTWEVTWFFILQGIIVAMEVIIKKTKGDKWELHPAISRPLTLAFVVVTALCWFFPPWIRYGVYDKIMGEYYSMVNFFADKVKKITLAPVY